MKVWCAWHRQNFGTDKLIRETEEGEGDSHGICPECEAIEYRKLNRAISSGFFNGVKAGHQDPVKGPALRYQPYTGGDQVLGTSDPDPLQINKEGASTCEE